MWKVAVRSHGPCGFLISSQLAFPQIVWMPYGQAHTSSLEAIRACASWTKPSTEPTDALPEIGSECSLGGGTQDRWILSEDPKGFRTWMSAVFKVTQIGQQPSSCRVCSREFCWSLILEWIPWRTKPNPVTREYRSQRLDTMPFLPLQTHPNTRLFLDCLINKPNRGSEQCRHTVHYCKSTTQCMDVSPSVLSLVDWLLSPRAADLKPRKQSILKKEAFRTLGTYDSHCTIWRRIADRTPRREGQY